TAALANATYVERATQAPSGAAFPQLGTPTFLTDNADFYRIDTALRIPTLSATDWKLRIHGMVGNEVTLSFADLVKRPLVERTITLTCVSNPIGGNLISTADFIGVPLRDVLLEAGVKPGADQLFSTSADGWNTGTPTSVVMDPNRGALLAIGMNGEALPAEHGFPVRMVVPGLYGYVSGTKWLVDIEATTFANQDKQGYWLERGWSQLGPIKTMSRIDNPQGFATITADTVTVAGIAWAQHTGIAKVEVRADGGPWQPATLSDEVSVDAWRMWHTELALPPGSHDVEVRATDKSGYTQTDQQADVIPNGASGWPSVRFSVA
ncbi:MAG: molybdopterin-dependent oxidoreductase, partial [Pseudonocardiales bacterium]|nr:molybdopterin-dependent oxidoreductase [Pseudonocardiales bacterium]